MFCASNLRVVLFAPCFILSSLLLTSAVKAETKAIKKGESEKNDKQFGSALAGTNWAVRYGNSADFEVVFEFHKDGAFICSGRGGGIKGTWKLNGKMLRIKTSDGSEYDGTFDEKSIAGTVRVTKGKRVGEYKWISSKKLMADQPAAK